MTEKYNHAHWYDFRLKLASAGKFVHISNKVRGSLYRVHTPPTQFNVFDYLLAGKDAQLEMESACTAHLKRLGAYLKPGAHVKKVKNDDAKKKCAASVVIPVYQRPKFISQAIESIQAQTVKNIEAVIVVNGGPEDPTVEEVKRYMKGGDKYFPTKPEIRCFVVDVNNIGFCLNYGCMNARGKYYVQLDSDDQLKPDAVEKILEVFESDPTIGMVIGSYDVWQQDPKTKKIFRKEEIPVVTHDEWTAENGRNNLLRVNGAGAPRSINIEVLEEMGWFGLNDSKWTRNYGEDYDLVTRVSEKYTIGRVWDPIYKVIRHAGSTDHSIDRATIDRNDEAKDWMRLEAIKRRRILNGLPAECSGIELY
jgi:glycosyltransferase involved in cell wall biosynthesis